MSKTLFKSHYEPSDENPSLDTVSTSDGPISIHISSRESSLEHVKEESKLPAVSKVHIKHEQQMCEENNRRRSSSDDEMTVNIYNVSKSVVTLEKQKITSSTVAETVVETNKEEIEVEVKTTIEDGVAVNRERENRIESREEIIVMSEKFTENSKSERATDEVRKSSTPELVEKSHMKSAITEKKIESNDKQQNGRSRSQSPEWTYQVCNVMFKIV